MRTENSSARNRRHAHVNKRAATKTKPAARIVRTRPPRYESLTARERATRERALNLLSDLRGGEGPYSKLLRKHRLNTGTARKYLGRNLVGGTGGKRVRASKSDRLVREFPFPGEFGDVPIRTHNSKDTTKLSEFFHDRGKYIHNKLSAQAFEAKWRGVRVAGQELFAEASAISQMAHAGVLKVDNLYGSGGTAR